MKLTSYKSPLWRLAGLFRGSRDRWKARAAAKQETIRQLRLRARDLTRSRDRWKARALAAEATARRKNPSRGS